MTASRIPERLLLCMCVILYAAVNVAEIPSAKNTQDFDFQTIEWPDLVPPKILEILLNPPAYLADIEDGSIEDQINSQIKASTVGNSDDAYQQALVSVEVNAEFDGANVRIPGFIVPLEFDDEQRESRSSHRGGSGNFRLPWVSRVIFKDLGDDHIDEELVMRG